MSCARLATALDREMLQDGGTTVFASNVDDASLPFVHNLGEQLRGRCVLRYLLPGSVGEYLDGSPNEHFVTPTPFDPSDTVAWLGLPAPSDNRSFVMLLDPARLTHVKGPRWTWGGGIEYILTQGFSREAIVMISPRNEMARWALPVT